MPFHAQCIKFILKLLFYVNICLFLVCLVIAELSLSQENFGCAVAPNICCLHFSHNPCAHLYDLLILYGEEIQAILFP